MPSLEYDEFDFADFGLEDVDAEFDDEEGFHIDLDDFLSLSERQSRFVKTTIPGFDPDDVFLETYLRNWGYLTEEQILREDVFTVARADVRGRTARHLADLRETSQKNDGMNGVGALRSLFADLHDRLPNLGYQHIVFEQVNNATLAKVLSRYGFSRVGITQHWTGPVSLLALPDSNSS